MKHNLRFGLGLERPWQFRVHEFLVLFTNILSRIYFRLKTDKYGVLNI